MNKDIEQVMSLIDSGELARTVDAAIAAAGRALDRHGPSRSGRGHWPHRGSIVNRRLSLATEPEISSNPFKFLAPGLSTPGISKRNLASQTFVE